VLVRFDNGVLGSMSTSWAFQSASNTERFSVVGERGSLTSDGVSLSSTIRGSEPVTVEFPPVHEFEAEIAHFADSIRFGTRPIHNHEDGISVLGIILAAYESARTRSVAHVLAAGELPSRADLATQR
jgi:predicted dehydrogenase